VCCRTVYTTCCVFQALDEDQPGDKVEHRKVFEEDRDFNQGAPALGIHPVTNPSLSAQ
jgi:hypothetical protein